jgi:hypothetical protein
MTAHILLSLASLGFFCLALLFYGKYREEKQLLARFIADYIDDQHRPDRQYVALALASAIYHQTRNLIDRDRLDWYERFEARYLIPAPIFNLTAGVALKYKVYGIKDQPGVGPCASMTRILLNALWMLDIPARELLLLDNGQGEGGGHVMVEFFDGSRWVVVSPADTAHVWRNRQGEMATAAEIQENPEIFHQIYKLRPDYDYLFDNCRNMSFEKFPRLVPKIIKYILGPESFAKLQVPKLYDQPRMLLLSVSGAFCLIFGWLAIFAG